MRVIGSSPDSSMTFARAFAVAGVVVFEPHANPLARPSGGYVR